MPAPSELPDPLVAPSVDALVDALAAAESGDAAALAALRAAGADLCAGAPGDSPLEAAALGGHRGALGVVLGAHPPQAQLNRALTFAALGGHRGCMDDLLAAGAGPLGCEGTLHAGVLGGAPALCDLLAALASHPLPEVREALLAPSGERALGLAACSAVRPGLGGVAPLATLLVFLRVVGEIPGLQQVVLASAASVICGAEPQVGIRWGPDLDWAPSVYLLEEVGGATLADARAAVAARHPGPALDERLGALEGAWGGVVPAEAMAAAIAPSVLAMQGLAFGEAPPPE